MSGWGPHRYLPSIYCVLSTTCTGKLGASFLSHWWGLQKFPFRSKTLAHLLLCRAAMLVHFLPLHICFKSSDTLCSHSLVQVLTYGVFWGRSLFYFRNLAFLALLAWEQKSQPGPGVVILNPWLQITINWGSFKKILVPEKFYPLRFEILI